ncbi:hypothetical protein K491DRAFT_714059 [Lophiostoma macrostomum CBS 122681]|uniref:NADH dehydrogenase [ubiquinone] 1 alpha subcomplex subunit 1 n=1 Tax=Lophiostoma macrostomum CBS 122681 TaxID=1314788 RepID=A0A6A6TDL9_9PLEO|nr:hypothetical protein K491DRAFT_714059 [Lophiostoma macrostomum CBS 122681]
MGVPFETLLPYGVMLGMFAFSAAAVGGLRNMQNGGKRARRGIDAWDQYDASAMTSSLVLTPGVVMERDRRLTGFVRGQTDKPEAPKGFETNNPWRVETRYM